MATTRFVAGNQLGGIPALPVKIPPISSLVISPVVSLFNCLSLMDLSTFSLCLSILGSYDLPVIGLTPPFTRVRGEHRAGWFTRREMGIGGSCPEVGFGNPMIDCMPELCMPVS